MRKSKTKLSLKQQLLLKRKNLEYKKRLKAADGRELTNYESIRTIIPFFESLPPGKQERWLNSFAPVKFLIGGFRSGKTETFAVWSIYLSKVNAPLPGLIISPTATNAQMVVIQKFIEISDKAGLRYEYYPSRFAGVFEFKIFFGTNKNEVGTIYCSSAESLNSWIGMTVAFGGMDEPFLMDEDVSNKLLSRVSAPGTKLFSFYGSGTPEPDKQNWGIDIIEKMEEDTADRFITRISTRDNKFIPATYIPTMEKKLDADQIRNYIDGIATVRKGDKVYYKYDESVNLFPADKFEINKNQTQQVLVVYDFNVNPMTAIELVIRDKTLYITEDYKLSSSNTWELTEVIINRLKLKYDVNNIHLTITGDRTSLKQNTLSDAYYNPIYNDYQIIQNLFNKAGIKYSMFLPERNPDVRDRTLWVNNLLEKKYLMVLSNCIHVREDLKFVVSKKGVEGFRKDKTKNAERTHLSDCVDYACWFVRNLGIYGDETDESGIYKQELSYLDPRRSW